MDVVVETSAGRIRGHAEDGLHVFRGVPFAEAPSRWAAPRPPKPWAGVRDALEVPPSAPQNGGMVARMLGVTPGAADEDCHTLDVFTPAGARKRPILVWVHGGSFTVGAGSQPVYDGARLAQRGDVVVVTIHYRLGALGWLALPGLDRERPDALGNAGLLDQIAALRFVRENAEVFGGDAGNVTVFGESAGAMSIGALLAAPEARGLLHRVILQSGATENAATPEQAAAVAERFTEALGLAPGDVDGLHAAPVEALLEAQAEVLAVRGLAHRGLPFQPTVDGRVLPRAPKAALAAGEGARVPILVGTNLDEWKFFGLADPKARRLDAAALLRRCERTIGDPAANVIAAYEAAAEGRSASPADLWFAIETDRYFRMPALRLAEAHEAPVYSYLFTWASPALEGALGSCHALEIPFVFGLDGDPNLHGLVGVEPAAYRLADRMQDAWLAFATDGAPGSDWPAYESGSRATMVFGAESALARDPYAAERRAWDGVL